MKTVNMEALYKALAAEFEAKAKENKVNPGNYNLEGTFNLEVVGYVDQAEDQMVTPTCDIPLLSVLARVIEKTGWAGELVAKYITEAATEALSKGEPIGDSIEYTKASLAKVREAITKKLPKKKKCGPMRRCLEINLTKIDTVKKSKKESA